MESEQVIHDSLGEVEYVSLGISHIYRFRNFLTTVTVRKIREEKDGMRAEIEISCSIPAYLETVKTRVGGVETTQQINKILPINLTSMRGKVEVANHLKVKYKEVPWLDLIEYLANDIHRKHRRSISSCEIYDLIEPPPIEYLLHPILQKSTPTLIYGDGGIGKSLLCQFFSILLSGDPSMLERYKFNGEGFKKVLLIDWEASELVIRRRQYQLCLGNNIPPLPTRYLKAYVPAIDMLDYVEEEVNAYKIDMVVIDSLGAALAGKLIDAEPVLEFINNKLRRTNVTTLIISHTPKDGDTPYGSTFITNACRSQWRLRKQQSPGMDIINVSLFHEKANDGKHQLPIGFSVEFSDAGIKVERRDKIVQEQFGEHLPLREQILLLLKDNTYTMREITDIVGGNVLTIKNYLSKLKREDKIIKLMDNKWGLKYVYGEN